MTTSVAAPWALRTLQKIEATIGAFFAFLVGFVLLVIGGDIVYVAYGQPGSYVVTAIWLTLLIPETWFLWKLKHALEIGHYPFAPWFALKWSKWPLLLRPLISLWWAAHFLIGIVASIYFDNIVIADTTTRNIRLVRCLIFIIIDLTIAYSANLYALLAITAAGGKEQIVNNIWRWRIALDLAVAIVAAFYPLWVRR
jgi:hypothetical protein